MKKVVVIGAGINGLVRLFIEIKPFQFVLEILKSLKIVKSIFL